MAHFSEDRGPAARRSVEADATGGDFFTIMGREIYADPAFRKADKRRGLVKNTIYGKAYGAGIGEDGRERRRAATARWSRWCTRSTPATPASSGS